MFSITLVFVLLEIERVSLKKLIMVGKELIMKRKQVRSRIFPLSLECVMRPYVCFADGAAASRVVDHEF